MNRKLRALLVGLALAGGLVVATGTASAGQVGDSTTFDVGYSYGTAGSFTWWNRVTEVQGDVHIADWRMSGDANPVTMINIVFDAMKGSTRIASEGRTVTFDDYPHGTRSIHFTLGNPDLVGGFDRIRITRCSYLETPNGLPPDCMVLGNFSRPF
ncbi:hypothetical protein OG738_00105 [Amycolatopsis sp. NBC_01488]|uniref:hypothetical protein n=1 Tax=Amycolatopsis sp. NBC_01488 TaxID=2903563 RepID=UPI002E2AE885|nr:hypothetical protein [Amycolatopsis sp. NBC_01488]